MAAPVDVRFSFSADTRNLNNSLKKLDKDIKQVNEEFDDTAGAIETASMAANTLSNEFSDIKGLQALRKLRGALDNVKDKTIETNFSIDSLAEKFAENVVSAISTVISKLIELTAQLRETRNLISGFSGLLGAELGRAATETQSISETFDVENRQLIETANSLAQAYGISFQDALATVKDTLLATSGEAGEVLEQLREYGPQLRRAGADARNAGAIIATGLDVGVFADKLPDAIKNASIELASQAEAAVTALSAAFGDEFANNLLGQIEGGQTTVIEALTQVFEKVEEEGLSVNSKVVQDLVTGLTTAAGEDAGDIGQIIQGLNLNLSELVQRNEQVKAGEQALLSARREYNSVLELLVNNTEGLNTQTDVAVLKLQTLGVRILKGLAPIIENLVELFTALIDGISELGNFLRRTGLDKAIRSIAVALGVYAIAVRTASLRTGNFRNTIKGFPRLLTLFRLGVNSVRGAFQSLTKALLANPFSAIIAGLTLAIQYWDELARAISGATSAQEAFNKASEKVSGSVARQEAEFRELIRTFREQNQIARDDDQNKKDRSAADAARREALESLAIRTINTRNAQGQRLDVQATGRAAGVIGINIDKSQEQIERFFQAVEANATRISTNYVKDFEARFSETEQLRKLFENNLQEPTQENKELISDLFDNLQSQLRVVADLQRTNAPDAEVKRANKEADKLQSKILNIVDVPGLDRSRLAKFVENFQRQIVAERLEGGNVDITRPKTDTGRPSPPAGGAGAGLDIKTPLPDIDITLSADIEPFKQSILDAQNQLEQFKENAELEEVEFGFEFRAAQSELAGAGISAQEQIRQEQALNEQRERLALDSAERTAEKELRIRTTTQIRVLDKRFIEERDRLEKLLDETDETETEKRELINAKLLELNETYDVQLQRIVNASIDNRAKIEEVSAERRAQTEEALARQASLNRIRIAIEEQRQLAEIAQGINEARLDQLNVLLGDSENLDTRRRLIEEENAARLRELEKGFREEFNKEGQSEEIRQQLQRKFIAERLNLQLELNNELAEIDQDARENNLEATQAYYSSLLEATDQYRQSLDNLSQIANEIIDNPNIQDAGRDAGSAFLAGLQAGLAEIPNIIGGVLQDLQEIAAIQGEIDILGATLDKLEEQRKQLELEVERINAEISKIEQTDVGVAADPAKQKELNRLNQDLEKTEKNLEGVNKESKETEEQINGLELEQAAAKFEGYLNAAQAVTTAIFTALQAASQAQLDAIALQLETQRERVSEISNALEEGGEAARNFSVEQLEAEEQRQERLEALRQREIQRQQNFATIELAIQGAIAVAKALASSPPPLNFILAAATAAAFGAQIAAIRQQARNAVPRAESGAQVLEGGRIKKFRPGGKSGRIDGRRHSQGGTLIEAEGGETIFSRKHTQEFRELFEQIGSGKYDGGYFRANPETTDIKISARAPAYLENAIERIAEEKISSRISLIEPALPNIERSVQIINEGKQEARESLTELRAMRADIIRGLETLRETMNDAPDAPVFKLDENTLAKHHEGYLKKRRRVRNKHRYRGTQKNR